LLIGNSVGGGCLFWAIQ